MAEDSPPPQQQDDSITNGDAEISSPLQPTESQMIQSDSPLKSRIKTPKQSIPVIPDRPRSSEAKAEIKRKKKLAGLHASVAGPCTFSPRTNFGTNKHYQSRVGSSSYGKKAASPSRPNVESAELAAKKDLTFKPDTSPSKDFFSKNKQQVRSSGYGKAKITKKIIEKPEEEPLPSFKPDMSVTRRQRKNVQASGYGKAIPQKASLSTATEETPSFKPDLKATAKTRQNVTSSEYGKNLPRPREIDESAYTPSFKPEIQQTKAAAKLKSQVPSRLLEPKTSRPERRHVTEERPLRHTLAADRTEVTISFDEEVPLKPFILDGSSLGKLPPTNFPTVASPIDSAPAPVVKTKTAMQLEETVPATGYGTTWEPPRVEVEVSDPPPRMTFDFSESTYVSNPTDLEKPVSNSSAFANAHASYGDDYEPVHNDMPDRIKEIVSTPVEVSKYYAKNSKDLPGIDDLPEIKRAPLDWVASSGYGFVHPDHYTMPRQPTPLAPENERKFKPAGGRAEITPIEKLPPPKRVDLSDVTSRVYSPLSSRHASTNDGGDEQTSILPSFQPDLSATKNHRSHAHGHYGAHDNYHPSQNKETKQPAKKEPRHHPDMSPTAVYKRTGVHIQPTPIPVMHRRVKQAETMERRVEHAETSVVAENETGDLASYEDKELPVSDATDEATLLKEAKEDLADSENQARQPEVDVKSKAAAELKAAKARASQTNTSDSIEASKADESITVANSGGMQAQSADVPTATSSSKESHGSNLFSMWNDRASGDKPIAPRKNTAL